MPAQTNGTIGHRVKEQIESAQERIAGFEGEAQRLVEELLQKGRASRKEVTNFLQRINAQELLDKNYVRELSGRAKHVRKDLGNRLIDLRQRVATLAGVATREQVEDLARDLEKLSRKIERMMPTKKPAAREKV